MNKRLIAMVSIATMMLGQVEPILASPIGTILAKTEAAVEDHQIETRAFTEIREENYKAYEATFGVTGIKSYTNNGGQYSDSELALAFDGNSQTYWETGNPNSSQFKNEIVITFNQIESINRMVYAVRPDAYCKGYAKQFSIYASVSETGDDFELVGTGSAAITEGYTEFKFKQSDFKRLKFVFEEASEDWASAAELLFFKEDEVAEALEELFVDETYYTLNPAYEDLAKINEISLLVAKHPLKERYIEAIEVAKQLLINEVQMGPVTSNLKASQLAVSESFDLYNESYQISPTTIKSVTNNGGYYGDSELSKLYDGDSSTHWETGRCNENDFKNEIVFTFDTVQEIERIILAPRQDADHKGFPLSYEIYGSLNENSNEYQLVAKGSTTQVISAESEIVFSKTPFKKLKFKFVEAYEDWAALSEISFYREDAVTAAVNGIFKDSLYTEITPEYESLEVLEALEAQVMTHPLKEDYMKLVNLAKGMVSGNQVGVSQVYTLSQRGNEHTQRNERRQVFSGGNLDVTGYYVMPGESFEVYVSAEGIMPQVVLAQVGEVDNGDTDNHYYALSVGKNEITAPAGTKGYAIYFTNKALPEEQAYAPIVRLLGENLEKYPVYIHGVTAPADYVEAVKNHKGENMTEIMGERFLLSVQNTEAQIAYSKEGISPLTTVEAMEKMIALFDQLSGYDINDPNPIHRPSKALYHYKATSEYSLFACNEYIHYCSDSARDVLSGMVYEWGYVHEFAHQIENNDMCIEEVTNNLYSIYVQRYLGNEIRDFSGAQNNLDAYINNKEDRKFGLFENLLVISQITSYFGEEAYSNACRAIRENPSYYKGESPEQTFIRALSEATGYDLAPHFEYYGYEVTEGTKAFTAPFKTLNQKISYMPVDVYERTAAQIDTFKDTTQAVISDLATYEEGFVLTLGTKDDQEGTVAYEIYRDGQLVGFTRNTTYRDATDRASEHTYEVIAYDYMANESLKSEAVSTALAYKPILKLAEGVTLKLNEAFNPLDYVVATTFDGEALTEVEVVTNSVDTSQRGSYEVVYKVTNQGLSVSKCLIVKVVSDYDYLSDLAWTSARTDYGTPRRNEAILGRVNGQIQSFEKGFGIHANGELVYDLGDHNYERFEALVGVDMGLSAQDNSSISFKVTGDGETLEETTILKHADHMVLISVPIAGVNELKIEVLDGGNGITSDHGIIVNPKLITNNAKPSLTIPKDETFILGEEVTELYGVFTATDAEDGDLTSEVKLSGTVNVHAAGTYTLTYSVMDSDGNEVVKERTIKVVDLANFTYVSDYDWTSASCGWGEIKKDLSPNDDTIRLTDDYHQEVKFEKGLGAHSHSTITYDLTQMDVAYFTAYVGVDRAMYDSVGSVSFEIWLDGEKVKETETMYANDAMQYMAVGLVGAKELKLVATEGGNGNGSDHAVWADAKFYSVQAKEVLVPVVEETEMIEAVVESIEVIEDTEENGQMTESQDESEVVIEEASEGEEAVNKEEIGEETISDTNAVEEVTSDANEDILEEEMSHETLIEAILKDENEALLEAVSYL